MKTITKTVAFLVAAAAFTACANQTIEPVSVSKQPQSIIARPDTLISVDYAQDDATIQPAESVRGAGMLDELNSTPKPRKPVVKPTPPSGPQSTPQPGVMPIALETQDIY